MLEAENPPSVELGSAAPGAHAIFPLLGRLWLLNQLKLSPRVLLLLLTLSPFLILPVIVKAGYPSR